MKWYWKVLIAIIGLLIIGYFSIDKIVTHIVDGKIKDIQKELYGKYNFEYKGLNVSIINKKIVLKKFSLITVVDSLNQKNKLDFTLDRLKLHFDEYKDILSDGLLHISYIELKKPSINYGIRAKMDKNAIDEHSFDDEPSDVENQAADSTKKAMVDFMKMDSVIIIDGDANIYHLDDVDKKILQIERLNLTSLDLSFNFKATNLGDVVESKDMTISLEKITSNQLKDHNFIIYDLYFRITENEVLISNFHFKNKEAPAVYSAKQKYRSPWFDIKVDEIKMGINPWHVYNKGVFYVKYLSIKGVDATIYNDVTLELKPTYKPMPSGKIRDIPVPISIDSLYIYDSKLIYQHKMKADEPGIFELSDLEVRGNNITNIDYLIDLDSSLILDVTALLWDSGKLMADINIDLKNELNYTFVKGYILDMPLKEAEKMVKPLFKVDILSGQLNNLSYDLTMNENIGTGVIRFDYTDLKIDLKKDKVEKKGDNAGDLKKNKFISFVANSAIIKNNIPGDKKYIPRGNMIFDRTKIKPIFDLYWNSIQTGLMDIMIPDALYKSEESYSKKIKKNEKKEVKEEKEEVKSERNEEKSEVHEEKKEEKSEKREERHEKRDEKHKKHKDKKK